ncbi:hypothetical protein J6590_034612 [Homalodisca vitripennis]|nr:hypothetical protein J6590_034612 [Homalodisca vitripennis]
MSRLTLDFPKLSMCRTVSTHDKTSSSSGRHGKVGSDYGETSRNRRCFDQLAPTIGRPAAVADAEKWALTTLAPTIGRPAAVADAEKWALTTVWDVASDIRLPEIVELASTIGRPATVADAEKWALTTVWDVASDIRLPEIVDVSIS